MKFSLFVHKKRNAQNTDALATLIQFFYIFLPGLPADIRQWSVAQVVEYFKSTPDCKNYVDLFEMQEVDGIALLLLTHEALVKCLGIKLGRAVKIMNRVQQLKAHHEHHTK